MSEKSRRRGRVRRSSSSSSCDSHGGSSGRATNHAGHRENVFTIQKKSDREENEVVFPSFWFFALTSSLILAPVSVSKKSLIGSFREYDISSMMYSSLIDSDSANFFKMRPLGVRWRDEATLARIAYNYTERMDVGEVTVMPLVTERPRAHLVRVPGQPVPTTSTASLAPSHDDPSLEDLELIDVLWRNDIAAEKGARQLQPAEQYERDLQLLTEKSVHAPLSAEESSRFEDLSKVYFEDFYAVPYVLRQGSKGQPEPLPRSDQLFEFEDPNVAKRELSTPTDEDLAELLADVSKEGGQLDRLTSGTGVCSPPDLDPLPLVNNVSLSEGIVFTPQNVSEMSLLQEQRQAAINSMLAPAAPAALYNESTMPSWMQQAEMAPSDVYPNNGYMTFQNDTGVPVVSTGSQYDHQYHANIQRENFEESTVARTASMYDPYYSARTTSFSNESSICSSTSTGTSPHYHSETENYSPHTSRYFGKLAPREDATVYSRTVCGSNGDNSVTSTSKSPIMPRRRGRQSKDEQLAAANRLPLTAKEISEMTLGELHKVLKNENLSEHQKLLIRKIRRRGKNKVAARTCRERRGERQRTMQGSEPSWNVPLRMEPPYQIHL